MTTSTFGLLAAATLSAGTLAAQSPGDAETLKLLRQTIADQTRNPDKIIRTYTNLPPAEVKSPAPEPEAAPVTVAQSKPAPAPKTAPAPALSPAEKKAAAAALERQFLNGKLSARQYEKALAELDNPSKPPAAQPVSKPETAPPPQPPPKRTQKEVGVAPPQPTVQQKNVAEVEAKIDDMIRQKEARESAAKTNAPPAPGAKLTKRQRLDALLRQLIDGKLSDAEYKKEREKILAEPEEGKQ